MGKREGSLQVQYPVTPSPTELLVLDTDYDSFACVYSCEETPWAPGGPGENKIEKGWVMTRRTEKTLDAVSGDLIKGEEREWSGGRLSRHNPGKGICCL